MFRLNLLVRVLFLTFLSFSAFSQDYQFWGTTNEGGENNLGTLFSVDSLGENHQVEHSFEYINPGFDYSNNSMVYASNGKMYGVTHNGGTTSMGVLFEYNHTDKSYKVLYEFSGQDGDNGSGALVEGEDGFLYGTTLEGGENNLGVIFEYNIATKEYTKLHDFESTTGSKCYGGFVKGSGGQLWGMTYAGGANNQGSIFSFNYKSKEYKLRASLSTSIGAKPYGRLTSVTDKFLGLTSTGGSFSKGALIEFDTTANTVKKLDSFYAYDGEEPWGSLYKSSDNIFYGTTKKAGLNGEGTIFKYYYNTNYITAVYNFSGTDGKNPVCDLVYNRNVMWGVTGTGGANGYGVVFAFDGSNYAVQYSFKDWEDGQIGQGNLIKGPSGNLFGITSQGGEGDKGVLYSYYSSYSKQVDLGTTYGHNPKNSVTQASNGKIYGLTHYGGTNGSVGVIYEIDPLTKEYIVKKELDIRYYGHSYSSLIEAKNGKLYALCFQGGNSVKGSLLEYDPENNYISLKWSFTTNSGYYPTSNLIEVDGNLLIGTTSSGGNNSAGTIIQFNYETGQYSTVVHFNGTNGENPKGGLTDAGENNLYGLTRIGGSEGKGVLYKYNNGNTSITKIIDFDGDNGSYPSGTLFQASSGKIYGLTNSGGASNRGTLFEFDTVAHTINTLYHFNAEGYSPQGGLNEGANGKLYGLTSRGGSKDKGTIFEFDPTTEEYSLKLNFEGENGDSPVYTTLTKINLPIITNINNLNSSYSLDLYPNPLKSGNTLYFGEEFNNSLVSIVNTNGIVVAKNYINNNSIENLELPKGLYLLRFNNKELKSAKLLVD